MLILRTVDSCEKNNNNKNTLCVSIMFNMNLQRAIMKKIAMIMIDLRKYTLCYRNLYPPTKY